VLATGEAQAFWTMPAKDGIGGRTAEMHKATMQQVANAS
jgi:hypothetical protein